MNLIRRLAGVSSWLVSGMGARIRTILREHLAKETRRDSAAALLPEIAFIWLSLWLADNRKSREARPTIIFFDRGLFSRDVSSLRKADKKFAWIRVPVGFIASSQKHLVPREFQEQNGYAEFESDPRWGSCVSFARRFHSVAKRRFGPDIIYLDANVDYWQTYAFRMLSSSGELRIYVMSKEIPLTRSPQEAYRRDYKGFWFGGNGIFCASPWLAEFFSANLRQSGRIIQAGIPRLDGYRSYKASDYEGDELLWLTFLDGYGVRSRSAYFDAVKRVAMVANESGRRLTIKAKNYSDLSDHKSELPIALKNTSSSMSQRLDTFFASSRVVIGANSLSILEALLTPLHVIVPNYLLDASLDLNYFLEEDFSPSLGLYTANSPSELEKILREALRRPLPDDEDSEAKNYRIAVVSKFISYFEELSSSAIVLNELYRAVQDRN